MSECGVIGLRWYCVKPAGHGGLHAYEERQSGGQLQAAAPPAPPDTAAALARAHVEGKLEGKAEGEALRAVLIEVQRMTAVGPPSPPGRKAPRDHWYDLLVSLNAYVSAALAPLPSPLPAGEERPAAEEVKDED